MAVAIAALLLAVGCGSTGSAPVQTPRTGGTLNYALDENNPQTLDPAQASLWPEWQIFYSIFDPLIEVDSKLNFVPALATSWRYSDLETLDLKLRQDVHFQDGTPFDSAAVKFNLDRVLADPNLSANSALASIDSVETSGSYGVVIHLKQPDGTLLAQLSGQAGFMVSPTALRKLGSGLGQAPVDAGTGPFRFVEWQQGDHVTVARNPGYWRRDAAGRRLPYLDQIIFHREPDRTAWLAGLHDGSLDATLMLKDQDVASIRADPRLTLRQQPSLAFQTIALNRGQPPFDQPARARAVALALDRAELVRTVFYGVGTVSHGPLSPASWAYDPTEQVYDRQDITAARAAATGFSFDLTLIDPYELPWGRAVQSQLALAGITVNLKPVSGDQLNADTANHDYQAVTFYWSPNSIDPDGDTYPLFHTASGYSGWNVTGYSNPDVDQYLEHARQSTDTAKRRVLYQEAQRLIVADAAMVFIRDKPTVVITSARSHGLVVQADQNPRFAETWVS